MLFEHEGGYEWMDRDGSILSRVANYDSYEFTLLKDMQMGCDACNKNVRLRDLQENLG